MPSRPSADDAQWGPARTYKARRGRNEDQVDHRDQDQNYDEGTVYGRPTSRRRRRHPVRWIVALLVIALIVYPLSLGLVGMSSLNRVDALSGADDTAGRNYLVVGSDSRAGTDLESVAGTRTDSIMLLHVPSGSGPTVIMSIPRDSYVEIPGHKNNKINASYAYGGPKLLVSTVEQNTGLTIDGYVETGFAGFGDIINALGGITICPKTALKDKLSGLDVQPGCQEADGTKALAYARMRHGDPLGDIGRAMRQREVIAQIAKKASSPAVLLNPFSAYPLATSGGKALTVDKQFGMIDLAYFVYGMKAVSGGDGISMTVPVGDAGKWTSVGQVVEWDSAQSKVVFDALKDDSTEGLAEIAKQQPGN